MYTRTRIAPGLAIGRSAAHGLATAYYALWYDHDRRAWLSVDPLEDGRPRRHRSRRAALRALLKFRKKFSARPLTIQSLVMGISNLKPCGGKSIEKQKGTSSTAKPADPNPKTARTDHTFFHTLHGRLP